MKKNKEVQRVPRPQGITHAMTQYHKATDPHQKQEILQKTKARVVRLWTTTGMILNNKTYNIPELAAYLNIDQSAIVMTMNKELGRMADIMDNGEGNKIARATLFGAIFKGLEIRALSETQLRILMAQQGEKYTPFLTGEVNKAMANLIGSQKPLIDIIKLMGESPEGSPLRPATQQNTNIYMTPQQALDIITQKSLSMIEDIEILDEKLASYGQLPDINARNQDLSTIGIKALKIPSGPEPTDPREHHDNRREKDGPIK